MFGVHLRRGGEGSGDPAGSGELPVLRRRRRGYRRGERLEALLPPAQLQGQEEVPLLPLLSPPRHLSLIKSIILPLLFFFFPVQLNINICCRLSLVLVQKKKM